MVNDERILRERMTALEDALDNAAHGDAVRERGGGRRDDRHLDLPDERR